MRIIAELKSEEIKVDLVGEEEEKILMLYEKLGKNICCKYGFDYIKLLKMMILREK